MTHVVWGGNSWRAPLATILKFLEAEIAGGMEFADLLSYLYATEERVYFRELVNSSSGAS